jgi:hypothetical protein
MTGILAGTDGDLRFGCPGSDPPAPDVTSTWAVSDAAIGSSFLLAEHQRRCARGADHTLVVDALSR